MTDKTPGKIYAAINELMKSVGAVPKGQRNEEQKFNFRGIDDIYIRIQPMLAKVKVFSTSAVVNVERETGKSKSGGAMFHVWLTIRYTFHHIDDGSSVSTEVIAEAGDWSDKSCSKAMSVGHKVAIIQLLAIPVAEDDPDAHSPAWAVADKGLITPAQFTKVKNAWWSTVADECMDLEKEVITDKFIDWVEKQTGNRFEANNWRHWSLEDFEVCDTALTSSVGDQLEGTMGE